MKINDNEMFFIPFHGLEPLQLIDHIDMRGALDDGQVHRQPLQRRQHGGVRCSVRNAEHGLLQSPSQFGDL